MSDWTPTFNHLSTIASSSGEAIGTPATACGLTPIVNSTAWPSSNLAIYVPFVVYQPILVYKLIWRNGSSVSGNFDIAIYDDQKHKLVSSGSTAQSGVSAIQPVDTTDTTLYPGVYYLAGSMDNGTGTVTACAPLAAVAGSWGCLQEASAFPLPTTATWVAMATAFVPNMAANLRVLA